MSKRALGLLLFLGITGFWPATAQAAAEPTVPTITAPPQGATFCSETIRFSGTSDPGDHVEIYRSSDDLLLATFIASGSEVGQWGGDVTLPNSGPWSVYAVAVNPSDNSFSMWTPDRSFTVITGGQLSSDRVWPNLIAPANRDGVRDTTTLSVKVEKPGDIVLIKILDGSTLIRRSPGMVASMGWKSWTWDGKTTSGAWAASKQYLVGFEWQKKGCTTYWAHGQITVDNLAPKISYVTDSPDAFFPVTDGYRDTVGVRFTVDQPANVMMRIYPRGSSTIVRQIGWIAYSSPTTRTFIWNGRRADGSLVPPGVYDYQFFTSDFYGNKRSPATGRGTVTVSLRKLLHRTQTIQKSGSEWRGAAYSGACSTISSAGSRYSRGLRLLLTGCDPQQEHWVEVEYDFKVAGASFYKRLRFEVYGVSTSDALVPVGAATESWEPDLLGGALPREGLNTFSGDPRRHIRSGLATLVLMTGNFDGEPNENYDIRYVKLILDYAVLV